MFRDDIIEKFSPNFKSIAKDCDRYSNELVKLIDSEVIEAREYIELSGKGSLWIAFQYIDQGLLDLVEAHVRRHVTSRDFYGPLFENTRATLARLIECSEVERVCKLYRAAIEHRLKALKAEAANRDRPTSDRQFRESAAKWVRHYLPAAKKMVKEYEALLASEAIVDSGLLAYQRSLQAIGNPTRNGT